jgi:hypothetical protein
MFNPKIVSFRGPLGGGKTYAANYLVKYFGFKRIAFADALKIEVYDNLWARNTDVLNLFMRETMNTVFSYVPPTKPGFDLYYVLPEEKIEFINAHKVELRSLLQWWGTEFRRGQDKNYWLNQWVKATEAALADGQCVAVDDARFDNEIDKIIEMGGIHIFILANQKDIEARLISRDGAATTGIAGHASEGILDPKDLRNTLVIRNDSSLREFDADLNSLSLFLDRRIHV